MIKLFINRIYRSVKIDPEVFDEVQKDKKATVAAGIVVILSSLAAGIGATHLGVKLFPDTKTKTTHQALLRSIGFSNAPGIIRVFGFNEDLMTVTFIGSSFWMLACMVVAVRQTLNYKSLWKSLGVVIIAWFVQAFALICILALTKSF